MPKDPRQMKTYTLSVTVIAMLEKRAAETGEKMSRLVEAALRAYLAMPAPEREEGSETGLAATRSEIVTLEALKRAGLGWHSVFELAEVTRQTQAIVLRALGGLEREGKAFCWGPGRFRMPADQRVVNGEIRLSETEAYALGEFGSCWSVESPLDALGRVVKVAAAKPEKRLQLIAIVERMGLGVAEIGPFREVCRPVFWSHLDPGTVTLVQNFAEREADERQSMEKEHAASEARTAAHNDALRKEAERRMQADRDGAAELDSGS